MLEVCVGLLAAVASGDVSEPQSVAAVTHYDSLEQLAPICLVSNEIAAGFNFGQKLPRALDAKSPRADLRCPHLAPSNTVSR